VKERKPYEKPKVTRILIRPQESVLRGCKVDIGSPCDLILSLGS